ncbi:DNA transposase THAP9 [Diabrotica undecimpunctata]|uniref:DNA transposase THAP9 n=1 Tax=Diabrotica undecimpunctata TaxID=50387 RepID=UPI003B633DB6
MVMCSAYGCKSNNRNNEVGVTFHRFPTDEPKRSLWIENMKIKNFIPTKNHRICSKHFENNLFYGTTTGKVKLLNQAVPTIFLELPKSVQPKGGLRKRKRHAESIIDVGSTSGIAIPNDELSAQVKRLKLKLELAEHKSAIKSQKIRIMSQKLRRMKKKILSIKCLIKELQTKNLLLEEHSILFENMPPICKELAGRKIGKKVKYSSALRQFAITLNFFSPKGYNYVREKFQTCLPHPSTISKWFRNVNGEPGFTKESLEILKKYNEKSQSPLLLSLIMDEMSIRKNVEWDGTKFHGYVDFGNDLQNDSNDIAKDAFVFMANCVNGSWKIPIGYFFINGLNGTQKANLVNQCLQLIETETGAHVTSLTFDGATANVAMTHILGCSRKLANIKPFFSIQNKKYFIFYDPCHMVKLIRNTFGDKRHIIIDEDGNSINWNYIEYLQELQEQEGLHLANKLRKNHVNFFNQKMKVRLAVQLLSASVADSLSYCLKELKLKEFSGCEATIKFIRITNNVFDILNSRSLRAKHFKKALCDSNIEQTKKFAQEAITYFSNLKFDNGQLVTDSGKKTGFLGVIVSLKSALGLYEDIVVQKKLLHYLPLYKVSQDHVELFFSSIRSKGGWNNNPTARQFTAAYKRLLVRSEIRSGGLGNCVPLDDIPILSGSSRFKKPELNICLPEARLLETFYEQALETIWSEHDYIMNSTVISECSIQIITYIAGFVARKLQSTIKCVDCVDALSGNKLNYLNSLITKKKSRRINISVQRCDYNLQNIGTFFKSK